MRDVSGQTAGQITRFDLIVDECEPVFDWLDSKARGDTVRRVAYATILGWQMQIVLCQGAVADEFRLDWASSFSEERLPGVMAGWRGQMSRAQGSLPASAAPRATTSNQDH